MAACNQTDRDRAGGKASCAEECDRGLSRHLQRSAIS